MNSTKTNPRKPKLNVRLLRRIKRHILEEPNRLEMVSLVRLGRPGSKVFSNDSQTYPPCGTTHCIAGWALHLSGLTCIGMSGELLDAGNLLGLADYTHLFFTDSWPHHFGRRYVKSKLPKTRAKIAADRIEHLIATGE